MSSVRLIALTEAHFTLEDGTVPTPEGLIAYCARVSSPNQENPNYEGLLRFCIREGHWSVFEQVDMTLEVITSRAIAAQILRHKSYYFQELCVAKDTLITTVAKNGRSQKIPIFKLYEYQSDPRMKVIWERGVRVYDELTKTFQRATIKEIFKTGVKAVYEVVLSDGKKIKSTLDHKFLSRKGDFTPLSGLSVGDFIAVNGQPVYQSKEWLYNAKIESIKDKTGVQGIADRAGCSYYTIRKWLKIHDLKFTKEEVSQYVDPWNKGLPSEMQPTYGKTYSPEQRQKMRDSSRKGSDSNLYKNGESKNRSLRQQIYDWQNKYKNYLVKKYDGKCCQCDSTEDLQIDHVKNVALYPELSFDINNLQLLCANCHKKKTTEEAVNAKYTCRWKRIESITYVGLEETYDIEVDHTSHNYIANGIVVHNSQRYSKTSTYEEYEARRQDLKNRQNSIDDLPEDTKDWFREKQLEVWEQSKGFYDEALERGVAKECARFLLPLNTQTRLYMKGTVRSWIHYFKVRGTEATQLEHREIALAAVDVFKEHFPIIYAAADLASLG